ncbi:amino acid adenylation domain-containing protein [Streptomyces sp. NBC_01433]|uniref:amino acid adenylation domain-containing protein n=1 Tax=Streptomyces sp. NBC_01433 TaxID=2903864 RepID=UPI002255507F|nr:amino acid adenylation domain-containing protein [Streptomyces sp. NBC_01433]MCX4680638.1 amino acid adenylation domain-containing protein [Streptomyces sp. NBC_01433]
MVRSAAFKWPAAVAVEYPEQGERLTYAQLESRADQLAAFLISKGIGRGHRVAVCLSPGVDLVVAVLAIVRAGAAYVPVDPEQPSARQRWLIDDCSARAVVADPRTAANVAESGVPVVVPRDLPDEPARWSHPVPEARADGDDPACVYYTSGTTGTPKGVVIPHRAMVDLVRSADLVDFGPNDRVGQTSNPAFDAATFEIWGALSHGARLVGLGRQTITDPLALEQAICAHGLTILFLTTSLFHQLARIRPTLFASLHTLVTGGEALDPRRVREVLTADPPRRLVNGYGPTECTTFACSYTVGGLSDLSPADRTVPIGRPIGTTVAHVLDADGRPVSAGGTGELWLGGPGLALGYLDRPELTRARFVEDPLGDGGGTLYRTGDQVSVRPDGTLVFLGRDDGQVKLRGFRIELDEVVAALTADPAVVDAVAWVHEPEDGERRLASQVIPVPSGAPAPDLGDLLRARLRQELPDYMVPATVDVVETFPLTPNGKLDRKALRPRPPRPSARGTAPRTPAEAVLCDLFADILSLPRYTVSADANFFDLGGSSLTGTQLVSRVRVMFGGDLGGRVLYEAPTPAAMADHLRRATPPTHTENTGAPTRWPLDGSAGTAGGTAGPVRLTGGPDLHRTLNRYAAEQGSTPVLVSQAALAATLSRLGAGSGVVLNSAVPGGVMTIAADTSGDPTFTELVSRVRQSGLAAYLHTVPRPEGLSGGVSLAMGPPSAAGDEDGDPTDPADTDQEGGSAGADVRLLLTERQGESGAPLGIDVVALGGLGTSELAEYWLALLTSALETPGDPVSRLRVSLAESLSGSPRAVHSEDRSLEATVPALFTAQVRRTPQAPALVLPDRTIDYAELDARADALARALAAREVAPGAVVASALTAPGAWAVTLLTLARTGAIHALGTWDDPDAIHRAPAASRPLVLVTDQRGLPVPADLPVLLAQDLEGLTGLTGLGASEAERADPASPGDVPVTPPAPPSVDLAAADPVFLSFPGGAGAGASSDTDEAMACLHGARIVADAAARRTEDGTAGLRTGWLPGAEPPGLAVAVEVLGVLASGGALVLPGLRPPGTWLADYAVRDVLGPEAALADLIRGDRAGVRSLVSYSASYEPGTTLLDALGDLRLTHRGGPGEAQLVRVHEPGIGPSAACVNEACVLDATLRPAPRGVWGALYVTGEAIARGYPGRPEASGSRFVPDPSGPAGSRMWRALRTARWTADGRLETVGESWPHDPFEQEYGTYLVLATGRGTRALWPADLPLPGGWAQVHPEDIRELCLDHIAEHAGPGGDLLA